MSLDLDSISVLDSSHTPRDMTRGSFTSNSKHDPTVAYSHTDGLYCANGPHLRNKRMIESECTVVQLRAYSSMFEHMKDDE